MKKIMILGAGTYQVPLIRTAKRMGLYTIVISIPGNYPGFALADKIYYIDTRDREAVLQAAREEQIDAICTSGTDVAVATIGYVCQKMGLTGIPYDAALTVTDKALMKEAFLKGGVCASRGCRACSSKEALAIAEELGYPVVVKRVDSSGSRGITVVKAPLQMAEAFRHALSRSLRDYVLVEGFLKGTEIGVDGFVQNGRLVFLAPHTKFVYQGATITIPIGHAFPYPCSDAVLSEIHRQMQAAVTATGIDNCSVNADVFVDGETVSIIEIGGRTGATCIPELISMYYGFDFYEQMIRNALGEHVEFSWSDTKPCMAKLLLSPVSGIITEIRHKNLKSISVQPESQISTSDSADHTDDTGTSSANDISIALDYSIGQRINAMVDGTDRIGHVIAPVDREEDLDHLIAQVRKCIYVDGTSLEDLWNE